jgi:predicted site-specific integrase-resolvase
VEQDPWRGTAEVAQRLGVSESQVRILCRGGRLEGRRHGPRGRWYIRESEIVRYLDAFEAGTLAIAA